MKHLKGLLIAAITLLTLIMAATALQVWQTPRGQDIQAYLDLEGLKSNCTGGGPPTLGTFFSPGPVSYAISAGPRAPGSWVGATLQVPSGSEGYRLVFQVYRMDSNLEPVYTVEEEASGTVQLGWRLPYTEGARYLLLVLAVDPGGSIEDYLCSIVEVPLQSVKVEMFTDKPSYRPGDTLRLIIVNKGPTQVIFGRMYTLYAWNGSGWEVSGLTPSVWTLEAIVLQPGGSYVQEISLEGAEPGLYRVVKVFEGEGTSIRVEAEAVFRVEP